MFGILEVLKFIMFVEMFIGNKFTMFVGVFIYKKFIMFANIVIDVFANLSCPDPEFIMFVRLLLMLINIYIYVKFNHIQELVGKVINVAC